MSRITTPLWGIVTLVLCMSACMGVGAKSEYKSYKDPTRRIGARIRDLLKLMSLEEKVAQMAQIDRENLTVKIVRDHSLGSILSGGGSVPRLKASPEEWIDMVNRFQNGSLSSRLGIPMIYGINAVHGNNNVYKATIFPHNIGLGSTRDPKLVKRIGAATALEARAIGIPYIFAPCVAVCRDPRWGRCYESYSEDVEIVKSMTEIILGIQGDIPPNYPKGVPYVGGRTKAMACAKHYVGDGGTRDGKDESDTEIDWHELLSIHMPPYNSAILKGVSTIMLSYSSWNGVKMHTNRHLVNEFLKGHLRFRGIVISDWEGVDRITNPPKSNYTYAISAAINAGIDMVMVPYDYTMFIDTVSLLVRRNVIPMSRIDDAVERILRVKFQMGLFENPLSDYSLAHYVGCQAHRDLAREAVRKSLVLLKNGKDANDEPLLPLPKKATKILVAGTHANNLGYQCGGWTLTWQGSGGYITQGTTILSGIANAVDQSTEIVYNETPTNEFMKSNKFSYAVVVVGEPPYADMLGDRKNLTIMSTGVIAIKNVCGNAKCVVVLISGRPLEVGPYLGEMDTLVAAWLPGSEGQGVADVLFGDFPFTGKSSRTWFKDLKQLPMNVGDHHYDPLFPFGFGLTTNKTSSGSR